MPGKYKGRMGNKRTPAEDARMKERRMHVARLYLQQKTQAEIAKILGVTQYTISLDLKALQESWVKSALLDMNAFKQRELERIDTLERESWKAWIRSCEKAKEKSTKAKATALNQGTPDYFEVTESERELLGDPRYLEIVKNCIDLRCKIMGVYREQDPEGGKDAKKPVQIIEISVRSREDVEAEIKNAKTATG